MMQSTSCPRFSHLRTWLARKLLALLLAAAALALPKPAQAQFGTGTDEFWGGTTGAIWNTTTNWWPNAGGTGTQVVPGSTSDAVFNITANNSSSLTVALNNAPSAKGLYFNSTGTTLLDSSSTTSETSSPSGADGVTVASGAGAVTCSATPPISCRSPRALRRLGRRNNSSNAAHGRQPAHDWHRQFGPGNNLHLYGHGCRWLERHRRHEPQHE